MISVLVTIALVGLVAWALTYFIPMPPKFQTLIYVVAAVIVLFYCLNSFGVYRVSFPR